MASNGDGACKSNSPAVESLNCGTCVTPSHVACRSSPSYCSGDVDPLLISGVVGSESAGSKADKSLTDADEAKKKQQLLSGEVDGDGEEEKKNDGEIASLDVDAFAEFCENLNCSFCIQLPERPVTILCGHNYCLTCFEKWVGEGNHTCAKCRCRIPTKMASNPHINSSLVSVIRFGKVAKRGTAKYFPLTSNQDCPENAFRAKCAKKTGKTSAAWGRIYVTIPSDHFGPITAENDPVRNQGVLVGESWEDRVECREWGVHFTPVSSIAGQSNHGAQSVALSGGYEDDEDHGEWFLFTGSGGINLNGNRRTHEDQKFEESNEALRVSCKFGYPVRVVRSYKEKRSAYAPEEGVRYDGVYRIEKCWRKVGVQSSYKVCRYLFVRCDNEPAPWTSDEHGDRPRSLPNIPEINRATDLFERKESPSWDFDEGEGRWRWMKPPPASKVSVNALDHEERKSVRIALTCLLLFVFVIFIGSSSILYRV